MPNRKIITRRQSMGVKVNWSARREELDIVSRICNLEEEIAGLLGVDVEDISESPQRTEKIIHDARLNREQRITLDQMFVRLEELESEAALPDVE
jgi:hypothetical protein